MEITPLTRSISEELERLQDAIVQHDADAIEVSAALVSALLKRFLREIEASQVPPKEQLVDIRTTAAGCSALLRRARLALTTLQNLHDLFSAPETYRVRS